MLTKLGKLSNNVIESGWILSLTLIPLFFNPYSQQAGRIFEGNKVFLLRSITLIMLLAWIVKLIETRKSGNSPFATRLNGAVRPDEPSFGRVGQVRHSQFIKHPLVILTALLSFFYLISTFLSPYFPISLRGFYLRDEGFYTFFSYLIIFFLVVHGIKKERQLNLLVTSLILASIPISVYGIFQYLSRDPVRWVGTFQERVTSTFGGPGFLGAYLIMVIPLTISRLISIKKIQNIPRLFPIITYVIILLFQLAALYCTKGRGAQIGLLVSLFFLALIISARLRMKWLFISVTAFVLIIAGFLIIPQIPNSPLAGLKPYLGRFGLETGSSNSLYTIKVRLAIWKSAESIIVDKPARLITGYGLDSLFFLYYKYYNPEITKYEGEEIVPDHSHNDTFDTLVTVGLPGLLLFLSIIAFASYSVLQYLGLIGSKGRKIIFYFCLIASFVIFVILSIIIGKGPGLLGLGIPIGLMFGIGIYLVIHILWFSQSTTKVLPPFSKLEILLIALFTGIIAHFVEIQFGMGITATRLYFWGFIALIVSIIQLNNHLPESIKGNQQQMVIDKKPIINTVLFYSLLTGLILAMISFSLLRYNLGGEQINYFVLIYISIIIISGFIVVTETLSSLRVLQLIFTVMLYLILCICWSGLFTGIYSSLFNAQTDTINYIILLYAWIGINLIVLMFLLPHRKELLAKSTPSPTGPPFIRKGTYTVIYPILCIITAIIIYQTNLKELYAETFYREATRTGQWEKSIADYQKSIQLSPHTDYYYESLSNAYLTKGDYQKSIEIMESARQADIYNPRHLRKLATLYRLWGMISPAGSEREKRFDKAIEYYKILTTDYAPANPLYFREYGDVLKYKGDYKSALEKYQQGLIKAPDSAGINLALGELYKNNLKENNQAISYYEKVLNSGAKLSNNQAITLCEFYFNQKRYEDFIRVNNLLLNNDSHNYQHWFYMAQAYKALGKKIEAMEKAKIALSLAPPDKIQLLQELIKELER